METYTYERPVGAGEAFVEAYKQVGEDMSLIGRGIGKMVQGDIPMANMGGPIMLFVIAEKSAKRGWSSFMRALAMTSVNLGLLNVLPVPVLDGGHLLFFGIEAVTRRPPSVKVREWANTIGLGLLLLLMVVVFRNDVMRFLLHAR
jgi:regulator of sigma E protease